jgi:type I restriction enzyme S subunit
MGKASRAHHQGDGHGLCPLPILRLITTTHLPLAPLEEIREVIQEIKDSFSAIDLLEELLIENQHELDQLDQSILAKAFRGELVPQDPNDEPAAVLLDRIRAEREQLGGGKKRGKAKG